MYIYTQKQLFRPGNEFYYEYMQSPGDRFYPHMHDFYELTLVLSGRVRLCVGDGTPFDMAAGDLLLLRPGDCHSKAITEKGEQLNLCIASSVMQEFCGYLRIDWQPASLLALPSLPMLHLDASLQEHVRAGLQRIGLLSGSEAALLRTLLRKLAFELLSETYLPLMLTERCRETPPPWLDELLQSLNAPDKLALGTAYLEEQTGLSREHICRSFRRWLGKTPTEYLNMLRLNYAVSMLLHSDHNVTDIAYDAGFQSLAHFYKVFRAVYGVTPKQYRRQHQCPVPFSAE